MKCENCQLENDGKYGSGRFCSSKCARGFSTKEKRKKINDIVSKKLIGRKIGTGGFEKGFDIRRHIFSKNDKEKAIKSYKNYIVSREKNTPFKNLGKQSQRKIVISEQEQKCLWCKISKWRELPITLQIDHIDGNTKNNKRENLRALCPNCHSQTNTFCSMNKRRLFADNDVLKLIDECKNINQIVTKLGLHSGNGYKQVKKILIRHNIQKYATVA